jgi:serine/threonine-protein kinase
VIGGKYVLAEVLGTGGMGVVHAALQPPLERKLAVKIPRPELVDDPLVRNLFRNEANAGSRISHRNVVGVLDFGDDAGMPYLVMEHVAGPRLGRVLHDSRALPVASAFDIVRQLAAGLEAVHGCGIVHADVKCDNVLVQTQDDGTLTPRLIDFGIARFVDDRMPQRHDTFVTGTPEYVAPEVALGLRPTPAADVYACGVMLYELVSGSRKLAADVVSLARRCPELEISEELDRLVSRMLARDPAARPADARELARCLDAISMPALPTRARARTVKVKPAEASIAERRLHVIAAIKGGNADRIANAYLDLAHALLDRKQPAAALSELEEGVELLMNPGGRGPVWRLLLSLAALR